MDKPTTPGGGGAGYPWPSNAGPGNAGPENSGADDSASEPSVGATGLFGTLSLPEEQAEWKPVVPPVKAAAPPQPVPGPILPPTPVLPPAPPPATIPPLGAMPLAEPVVHKVVLGGSSDESPTQLLDRIRMVTAERATSERPAAAPAAQGSGGFTELLRTLGSETPVPGKKAPGPGQAAPPLPNSGFTSLLQTLNAPSKPAIPPSAPAPPITAAPASTAWTPVAPETPKPAPAAAPPAPAAPAPAFGGFTELLRMTGAETSTKPAPSAPFGDFGPSAAGAGSAGAGSAPPASQPGEFTRLFGTFSASEAGGPAASAAAPPAEPYRGGGPGSFTRMLSLEQASAPLEPVYREETPASRSGMDYGLTPNAPAPAQPGPGSLKDSFFQEAAPAAQPVESTPAAGVGITRLIQMLDAPVRQDTPAVPSAPVPAVAQGGPGVWTQTFASLSSAAPPAPAASPQSWQPPIEPAAPSASPVATGPSEFTRILDASRMREQAMKGGAPPQQAAAPAPAQTFAPMPQMQMPAYAPPPMPQVPQMGQVPPMAGMKPMPQPGGFAPPPMPGGFAAPAVPAPQPPAAGKLQQFVPILLVVAIVLLVVLIVTVIFLLKK